MINWLLREDHSPPCTHCSALTDGPKSIIFGHDYSVVEADSRPSRLSVCWTGSVCLGLWTMLQQRCSTERTVARYPQGTDTPTSSLPLPVSSTKSMQCNVDRWLSGRQLGLVSHLQLLPHVILLFFLTDLVASRVFVTILMSSRVSVCSAVRNKSVSGVVKVTNCQEERFCTQSLRKISQPDSKNWERERWVIEMWSQLLLNN